MAVGPLLRRIRKTAVGGLNLLLLLYCAFLAGVILYHYPVRFDLSADKWNTLSDDTLVCLKNLTRPVEVIVAFGEADPLKRWTAAKIIRRTEDVLRQMALRSDKVKIIDVIDVFQRNESWLRLKQRYNLSGYNRVILLCGNRRQEVRMDDLADLRYDPRGIPRIKSFRVERALTAALRRLEGQPHKIYVLRNEGAEGMVGPTIGDTTPRGFKELATELQVNNYEVKELDLLRTGEVPADCDILMSVGLIGPLPHEVKPIENYLKRGGKLFMALNPLVEPSQLRFLAQWGFAVEPAWTVMQIPIAGTAIQTESVIATGFNKLHPITRKFEKGRFSMKFVFGRPIGAAKGPYGEREGIIFAEGKNVWGERRIDDRPWSQGPSDIPPPVCLAGVVESKTPEGKFTRIALFGAANWLTNRDIQSRDHLSILHNTLWWLLGQEELVSVRTPEDVERNLNFDAEGKVRRLLGWTLLGFVPGCAVLAALVVFLIRRK